MGVIKFLNGWYPDLYIKQHIFIDIKSKYITGRYKGIQHLKVPKE